MTACGKYAKAMILRRCYEFDSGHTLGMTMPSSVTTSIYLLTLTSMYVLHTVFVTHSHGKDN